MQAKVNDRGIASLAYNVLLRSGVTAGMGVSLDTQKLNESAHKVCNRFFPSITCYELKDFVGRHTLRVQRVVFP